MPTILSSAAILEKNRLDSAEPWILLLDIWLKGASQSIPITANNQNVTWPSSGGTEYVAFPFELDDIEEEGKAYTEFEMRIGNVNQVMEAYMEADPDGGVGSTVIMSIVHGAHLDLPDAEVTYTVKCLDAYADSIWAHFVLGSDVPWQRRFPRGRIDPNYCRYKRFGGPRCQYTGVNTVCDRTLITCRSYSNSNRFGGFPGAKSSEEI
uniref:Putative tail protein n=1 Tax=viral metagenome TaxID=1070528 RepID=A0A6H1ZFP7_9ZZZZ